MSDQELISGPVERAVNEPARKGAELYRALAGLFGDEEEARLMLEMANQLEEADRRCREFNFRMDEKTRYRQ